MCLPGEMFDFSLKKKTFIFYTFLKRAPLLLFQVVSKAPQKEGADFKESVKRSGANEFTVNSQ